MIRLDLTPREVVALLRLLDYALAERLMRYRRDHRQLPEDTVEEKLRAALRRHDLAAGGGA